MTTIRARLKVPADGNVIVPVGASEAGTEVDVVVTTFCPLPDLNDENIPTDAEKVWKERLLKLEGSIDDPSFKRPEQLPNDPIESFD